MPKRYCDKCIAEKVTAGKVPIMYKWCGNDNMYRWDFSYNKKCDLCGELSSSVTKYPPMDIFYKRNSLLNKFRSVTSLSAKDLKELQKECNELGIPIGDVGTDVMKKVAIDDKSHFCHAVETREND